MDCGDSMFSSWGIGTTHSAPWGTEIRIQPSALERAQFTGHRYRVQTPGRLGVGRQPRAQ